MGLIGHTKNMLVNFGNSTLTYKKNKNLKMSECARKLKCFQTNVALKIKLLIRQKIGFMVPLIVPHNLS